LSRLTNLETEMVDRVQLVGPDAPQRTTIISHTAIGDSATVTIEEDGFVQGYAYGNGSTMQRAWVMINGRDVGYMTSSVNVSQFTTEYFPVFKGDKVLLRIDRAAFGAGTGIFFCPPRTKNITGGNLPIEVGKTYPPIVDITGTYYASRPDLWPVDTVINFGGKLRGVRKTGTFSGAANTQLLVPLNPSVEAARLINSGGGVHDTSMPGAHKGVDTARVIINPLRLDIVCSSVSTNRPYSVWVLYEIT